MATPRTEAEPQPSKPQRSARSALIWGAVCAVCAGGFWVFAYSLTAHYDMLPNANLKLFVPRAAPEIALTAAIGGLVSGVIVGLSSTNRGVALVVLGLGGTAVGAVGGLLTLPTIILLREQLDPLGSGAVLWCVVGFFAGGGAHYFSESGQPSEHSRSADARVRRAIFLFGLLGVVLFLFVITTTRY